MVATASLPIHLDDRFRTPGATVAPAVQRFATRTTGLNVNRPIVPWRWRTAIVDAIQLVGLVWSIPFVIVAIGTPLALAILALLWLTRWTLGAL
jgi:hypothetical protein